LLLEKPFSIVIVKQRLTSSVCSFLPLSVTLLSSTGADSCASTYVLGSKVIGNHCGMLVLAACNCSVTWEATARVSDRDEHWTGLGLDWIRTMPNFVDFGSGLWSAS